MVVLPTELEEQIWSENEESDLGQVETPLRQLSIWSMPGLERVCFCLFFFFFLLPQVLVATCGILDLRCGMQIFSCSMGIHGCGMWDLVP